MARLLESEELVHHFTLAPGELGLLRNKAGATRLGFGVLLKFVQWRGRFPAPAAVSARERDRSCRAPGRGGGERDRAL